MNNPGIKRLAKELQEIQASLKRKECENNKTEESIERMGIDGNENLISSSEKEVNCIEAHPLKDDLFEWHFTLKGPNDSDYSEGLYHGRINFPSDYPFSPPSIYFLTPNGRWEIEKKVCLSVTGFHPEMWQPAWGIRTILLALRDHFTVEDKAAIGYLDYSPQSRRELAQKSKTWKCKQCPYNNNLLTENNINNASRAKSESNNLLIWIGIVLLILSILISYFYLVLI